MDIMVMATAMAMGTTRNRRPMRPKVQWHREISAQGFRVALGLTLIVSTGSVRAQAFRVEPSVYVAETFTDNGSATKGAAVTGLLRSRPLFQ